MFWEKSKNPSVKFFTPRPKLIKDFIIEDEIIVDLKINKKREI